MSILPLGVILGNRAEQPDKAHKSLMSFSWGLCLSSPCVAFEGVSGSPPHITLL